MRGIHVGDSALRKNSSTGKPKQKPKQKPVVVHHGWMRLSI